MWAPDRPVEDLTARWAQQPSQFLAIDGMSVHLRDEGPKDDPEPIILLHGTGASSTPPSGGRSLWHFPEQNRNRAESLIAGFALTWIVSACMDGDLSCIQHCLLVWFNELPMLARVVDSFPASCGPPSCQKQSLAAKRKVCVLMPLKILFDQRFNKSVT